MGDFNLDLLKSEKNPKINEFINLMFSNGFFPCIDRPTRVENRVTGLTATIIDNIITNDLSAKIDSAVFVTDIADHFPICSISNYKKNTGYATQSRSSVPMKQTRKLNHDNIKSFKNGLSLIKWDNVYDESNPEKAYEVFHNKLSKIYNIHCPLKATKPSKRKTPRKPWITQGLIKSINTKDKLYKKYITNPNSENKMKYQKYRNTLQSLLRISKKNHITSELDSYKNNMKKTWQTLNNLLGRNVKPKTPSHFTDDDGSEIKDPIEIANKFNNFFTNIGPSLAAKIPPQTTLSLITLKPRQILIQSSYHQQLIKRSRISHHRLNPVSVVELMVLVLIFLNKFYLKLLIQLSTFLTFLFPLVLSHHISKWQKSPLSSKLVINIHLITIGLYQSSPLFLKS
jgi:hypothetical protein